MKLPIAILSVVIAIIAGVGWHQHQQLAATRAQVAKSPVTVEPPVVTKAAVRPASPGPQESVGVGGKTLADEYIAAFTESMTRRSKPGPPDPAERIRQAKIIERAGLLSTDQLDQFIAAITGNEAIAPPIRGMMVGQIIHQLANDQPQVALALCLQTREFFKEDVRGISSAARKALLSWGKTDFTGALDWLRGNAEGEPPLIDSQSKSELLACFDGKDYNEAFKLITEFQIEPYSGTQSLMGCAKTPEERVKVVEALRAYLPTLSDKDERWEAGDYALASMGNRVVVEGFEAATRWAEIAKLTPVEIASFAKDFGSRIKPGEHAEWLAWFGEKIPANRLKRPVNNVIYEWTKIDHAAVGNWLVGAPAGAVKNLAVGAFAGEVAAYEPDSAVKWALTLPAGKDRQECLTRIYCNLPQENPQGKAAAEAFAKKYGIE